MDEKIIPEIKKNLKLKEIEVASSPWKLVLGLMLRKKPRKGYGMLFDFHRSGRHGIWTLFMRFPIDIYFLGSDGDTIDIVKNAKPLNIFKPATWKIYRPKKPCRYVVEVSSGRM